MSSIAPTSTITQAPASTPQRCTVPPECGPPPGTGLRWIVSGIQIAAASRNPARIARPPSSGVSRVASPRSLGVSTAPIRRASRFASGVSSAATAVATRNP